MDNMDVPPASNAQENIRNFFDFYNNQFRELQKELVMFTKIRDLPLPQIEKMEVPLAPENNRSDRDFNNNFLAALLREIVTFMNISITYLQSMCDLPPEIKQLSEGMVDLIAHNWNEPSNHLDRNNDVFKGLKQQLVIFANNCNISLPYLEENLIPPWEYIEKTFIPPASDSPKNILNALNDDCIGEILRRLPTLEHFLSAAWTCKRFQECAKIHYNFKNITIEKYWSPHHKTDSFVYVSAENATLLLEPFGTLIKSIEWTSSGANPGLSDEIYASIVRFCHKTLRSLAISNYSPKIDERNFFDNLDYFELKNAKPAYVRYDPLIRYLKVTLNDQTNPWYLRRFGSCLHTLHIESDKYLTDHMIEYLLEHNPQLKALKLNNCELLSASALKIIGTHSTELEKLMITSAKFRTFQSKVMNENVMHLKTLRGLKHLRLSGTLSLELLIKMFADNGAPIEALACCTTFSETVENLPTLEKLKTLSIGCRPRLFSSFPDSFLPNLMKTQTALNDLIISSDIALSMQGIISILESGKDLTRLEYCTLYCRMDLETYNTILRLAINRVWVKLMITGSVNVPIDIQDANRKWLDIGVRCQKCCEKTHLL